MNQSKQGAEQNLFFQLLCDIGKLSTEAHERGGLYIDEALIAHQLGIMDTVNQAANFAPAPTTNSAIDGVANYTSTPGAKIAVHASVDNLSVDRILSDAVATARDYSFAATGINGQKNCGQVSASFALVHNSTLRFSSFGSNPIAAFNIDPTSKRTSVTLINELDFPGEIPPLETRNEKKLNQTKFNTELVLINKTTGQKQTIDFHDFTYLYNALIKRGLLKVDTYQYLPTKQGKYWVSDDLIHAIEKELLRTNFALQVTQLYNGQPCTQFFLNPDSKENTGEWKYTNDTLYVGIFDQRAVQNSVAKTLSYLNGIFSYFVNSSTDKFDIAKFQFMLDKFFFGATSTLFTINNKEGAFFISLFKGEKVPFIVVMGSDPADEARAKLSAALPSIFSKTEFVDLHKSSTAVATTATTTTTVDMSASTLRQFDDFVMLGDDNSSVARN